MVATWQEVAQAGMVRHLDLTPEFLNPGQRVTKEVKKGIFFTLFRSSDPADLTLYAKFFRTGYKSILPTFLIGEYKDNGRTLILFDD